MVGLGMRLKLSPCLASGLDILLELVESTGTWPQSLLDAYIAMIPKADMEIPLLQVNGPSVCSLLCTGCGPPFGLDIFGSGLRGGCLNQFIAQAMV